jgi:hypothetical protein
MLVASISRFEPEFPLREFPIVVLSLDYIPTPFFRAEQLLIRQRSVVIEAGPVFAQSPDVSQRIVWRPLLPRRFSRAVRRGCPALTRNCGRLSLPQRAYRPAESGVRHLDSVKA